MKTVFIKQLIVYATIGIFAWEQQIKQKLSIDLDIFCSDDLMQQQQARYDYSAIAARLTQAIEQSEFAWLEQLADALTLLLTTEFNVTHAKLSINKVGAVPNAASVGVQVDIG